MNVDIVEDDTRNAIKFFNSFQKDSINELFLINSDDITIFFIKSELMSMSKTP